MKKLNWSWFWRGFGSAFSVGDFPRSPEVQRILDRTDEEAMSLDWQAVGDDLRCAMAKVDETLTDEQRQQIAALTTTPAPVTDRA